MLNELVSNDIGAFLMGVQREYSDSDARVISGPEDLDSALDEALGAPGTNAFLSQLQKFRPSATLKTSSKGKAVASTIKRLADVAKQVNVQSGRIEAEWLRRPNTLVSIYGTSLAPAATVAFSLQPGSGASYYRLLGFICSDEQANIFGFTSLKVGGQEHVNMSQTTPTAPVANAVPWAILALKEARLSTNIAPWSGQLFDPSQPLTGTIANMTGAGHGDAFTGQPRITVLCQTDPCGMRYQKTVEASSRMFGSMKQALGVYAGMIPNR